MPHISRRMNRAILALGLCALAGGCRSLSSRGPVAQSVATCRQLTQQGVNAMERGDWKRAESLLARAVQTSATDADARRNYAETLWHRGATQDALVQLEEARRLAVEDPSLAVRTGELYLALGQVSMASQMVDEALRLDPKLGLGLGPARPSGFGQWSAPRGAGRLSAIARLRARRSGGCDAGGRNLSPTQRTATRAVDAAVAGRSILAGRGTATGFVLAGARAVGAGPVRRRGSDIVAGRPPRATHAGDSVPAGRGRIARRPLRRSPGYAATRPGNGSPVTRQPGLGGADGRCSTRRPADRFADCRYDRPRRHGRYNHARG